MMCRGKSPFGILLRNFFESDQLATPVKDEVENYFPHLSKKLLK